MEKVKKSKKKIIIISIISVLLAIALIILPITTVIVYESIFGERYETASWLEFSIKDYEGLQMERSRFITLTENRLIDDNRCNRQYN